MLLLTRLVLHLLVLHLLHVSFDVASEADHFLQLLFFILEQVPEPGRLSLQPFDALHVPLLLQLEPLILLA